MEHWLARHPENRGRIKLVFRGYANDRQYMQVLRERVQRSPAGDHIAFVDYVASATPAEIYRGFQAVLLLSSYEGFGLPIIEAQSLGLPVVCSDLAVFREIGGAGVIRAQPRQAAAVADQLQRLLEDHEFYAAQQQQGFQNVRRFDWNHAAQQTLAVYRAAGT
jgi:glycosyltransferase involved in cell wall biosynthesis